MHIVDYFLNRATAGLGIEHLASGSLTLVQAFTLLSNLTQKRNNPNTGFVLLGRSSNLPAHNYLTRTTGRNRRSHGYRPRTPPRAPILEHYTLRARSSSPDLLGRVLL
mgnify:FL=1